MRWLLLSGRSVWKNDARYRIDWDKKSKSKLQFQVKQFLKEVCPNHVLFEEYTLPGTLLKVDFIDATKKIAIEVHGVGHVDNGFNKHFHNNSRLNYLRAIQRDVKKAKILELNGYILVEVLPDDLPLTKTFFLENYQIRL